MKVEEIIQTYGTPFYLYHEKELTQTVSQIREYLPQIGVCFAMKAAPILTKTLDKMTDRLEVCSPGEYEICCRAKAAKEKLLISGVNKSEQSMRRILESGGSACAFTIESDMQFELLSALAKEYNCVLAVYIRLSGGNQFGVDREGFGKLCRRTLQSEGLSLLGIHYFTGTQKQEKRIEAELAEMAEIGRWAKESLGREIMLEYGPGLSVPYFEDLKKPQGRKRARESRLEHIAEAVERSGIRKEFSRITFEYGRMIAAWAGEYLTGVADLKQTQGQNYCILDGGLHQISYYGAMAGMKVPPLEVVSRSRAEGGEAAEYLLAGSLCSANDVLIRQISLPVLQIGDVLRFQLAGAYALTESMALFLSRDLPAVLLEEEEGTIRVLRSHLLTDGLNDGSVNQ